jgi:hypothetical protein
MASKKSSAKPTLAQAYKTAQKSTAAKPKVDIPKPIKDTGKAVGKGVKAVGKAIGDRRIGELGDVLALPINFLTAPIEPTYSREAKKTGKPVTERDVQEYNRYNASKKNYDSKGSSFFTANTGKGKKATSIGGKIADVGIGDVVSGVGKGVAAVGKAVYNAKVGKKVTKPASKKSMPKVKKK